MEKTVMRYKLLGRSGLRVSEVCLGAMAFGEEWRDIRLSASQEECRKIFDAFAEAGGNFIDTANYYNAGRSEEFLGDFIGSERGRFVVATKYSLMMREGDPNGGGNHRKSLFQSLEASLRRLKTDYIDLYWLHAWDFMTPVEEVMRALDDAVRAGKILYVGISDAPAWIVAKANTIAELRGWTPFIGLQVQYSLVERAAERDLLPMARHFDIGVTAWSPLGMGVLTGKYGTKNSSASDARRLDSPALAGLSFTSERSLAIAAEVRSLAEKIGRKPSQIALSWVRQKGAIPIIGARKVSQIQENLGCLDLELTAEQMWQLDEASKIELGFPHEFLQTEARGPLFGDFFERIDNHHR
jgi:aryl-alcohol dehydrogenase-like predicted oxidoreductase